MARKIFFSLKHDLNFVFFFLLTSTHCEKVRRFQKKFFYFGKVSKRFGRRDKNSGVLNFGKL